MKISIAMTTYNGEKFLLEQLNSFITQTTQPDELIITDDCSTDKTIDILKKFKINAPFEVKIYANQSNLGYTQNFNKALQLCTGDLVFLSDQDDVWFPNKIEYMVDLAKQHPNKDLFMINTELVDINLQTSGLNQQEQVKNAGAGESSFVLGCCMAARKTFLDAILPIPEKFKGHDNWIAELADYLHLRLIDKTVLQYYRRHGSNESNNIYHSLTRNKPYSVRIILKKIANFKNSHSQIRENELKKVNLLLVGFDGLLRHSKYSEKAKKQINIIQVEVEILKARLEVVQIENLKHRFLKAWKLYKKGYYTSFKPFLIDMITKQEKNISIRRTQNVQK